MIFSELHCIPFKFHSRRKLYSQIHKEYIETKQTSPLSINELIYFDIMSVCLFAIRALSHFFFFLEFIVRLEIHRKSHKSAPNYLFHQCQNI